MLFFDKQLLNRNDKVHLAFSGGIDSTAVAHFLKRGGWDVELLHIKHFDNENSKRIAKGVRASAASLGLPLLIITPNPSDTLLYEYKTNDKYWNENGAYHIRNTLIRRQPFNVVIAHTLNDLAESYMLNCMKGVPMHVPLYAVSGNKIRPFLRTPRSNTEDYVQSHGLSKLIVPDDMHSQRKILRETVFPALNNDLTTVVRRLFIANSLIYGDMVP